jgi:glucose/arabinose dehydrogenase
VAGLPDFSKAEVIFKTSPCLDPFPDWGDKYGALVQNGGRIGLSPKGTVLLTVGEFRLAASSLVEQINFPVSRDALNAPLGFGAIYDVDPQTSVSRKVSFGNRNPQGMAIDLESGHAWVNEHGPQGGDEINLVPLDGDSSNYGYVEQTLGKPYGGWDVLKTDREFAKTYIEKVGVEGLNRWCQNDASGNKVAPVALLGPDSGYAPSQLLILEKNVASGLEIPVRTMLMATLANQALWAFDVQGTKISNPRRIPLGERIRDIVQSEDGSLYLSFDSGSIMKVSSTRK